MVHWQCTITKDGQLVQDKEGYMKYDETNDIITGSAMSGSANAVVSTTVQRSIAYGEVKVSFTLTANCEQKGEAIDALAKALFRKATEYTNSAMEWAAPGLEPLQIPPP